MPNNQIQSLTVNGTTYDIVDNTSGYITADSPALTGTPTAPTPLSGASDTQIATVKYVQDSMAGAGAGTVTSVRVQATSPVQSSTSTAQSSTLDTTISLADGYGDTKNPYGTKTANYVLAGPSSGSAVVPSFRQLVAADIPDLSDTYLTSSDIADKADKFIVHIGSQISGDYYQIGETYEQILSAAHSGSQLVAVDIDMTYPYLGVANMEGAIVIGFGFSATYNGTAILNGYMILENNTAMKIYSSNIIPTKVSDLTNDSGFITSYTETDPVFSASAAAGITSSDITNWNGKTSNTGTVTSVGISNATNGGLSISGSPITSSGTITVGHSNVLASAQTTSGIYPIKIDKNGHISEYGSAVSIPTKTSDLTNDSGFITGMTILSYGSSTWNDFLTAYNANKIVYCRASSNSNPATGSQTRLAFMAYVNNATTPTNVEFQYYRSVSTHTESQQGDQVYVYKLDKTTGWSVTVREASVKVVAGTGLSGTYSKGTMTLTGPTNISAFTNDSGYITSYTETDPTVPSWAKAASKPTYTASEVGALPSNTTYVSKITTTAGAHTAISNKSGAVSFNVPTKTSHLTNDSGYINNSASTPTANTVAKFDSSAHMNSGDMSAQDVSNFVNALDAQGVNLADYVVATGVDGIWTYRKWASGLYDAWYIGSVNLLAGTAWGSGFYYHQSSSALTPPSFSLSVSSLVGSSRSAQLAMFCGVNTNYSQYWATAASGTGTIPVRLDMQGRWK